MTFASAQMPSCPPQLRSSLVEQHPPLPSPLPLCRRWLKVRAQIRPEARHQGQLQVGLLPPLADQRWTRRFHLL